MPIRTIDDFFENEFTQFSVNNAFQSLANYVDGFKPTQRKVIYTVKKHNINKKTKVDAIANDTAKETQYLGGSQNIEGVIVNISKSYTGSNNLPLLKSYGDFGIRQNPVSASSRYIYASKADIFDLVIKKDDDELLIKQEFEGYEIEPRVLCPVIPMLIINGSNGIGTGFSQKILARNPKHIIKYLINKLSDKGSRYDFKPHWKGFDGNITKSENKNKWIIEGLFDIKNTTTVEITELPITYNLKSYIKILNKLEDDKKIVSYKDKSNPKTDKFHFIIKFKREELAKMTQDEIMSLLKLRTAITENITCIDENNKVIVFDSVQDLFEKWFDFRMKVYEKRKTHLLNELDKKMGTINNRIKFIQGIVDGDLIITKKSKSQIIKQLSDRGYDKQDNSFDYLLNMNLYSLTSEKIKEMKTKKKEVETEIKTLKSKTLNDIWIDDLNTILQKIKYIRFGF